jgi:allantoinase
MRWGLRSRRVVQGDAVAPATIVIEGERIVEVASYGLEIEVEDVGDALIMPGLVDAHVHVNEPGRTEWEGFVTATRAAAAGGVTTIVDMPLNCIPVTTTESALEAKLSSAADELHVDAGFWGGVIPGNAEELEGLATGGVLGCKAFMIDSGIEEFPWSDEAALRLAMTRLKDLGLPLLAHAEIDLGAQIEEPDPRRYLGYLQSRPRAWEDAAIALLIRLCRETRCAVHVVHLSSAGSIEQIRRAKHEGLPITVETCAHYLCLSAEEVPDGDTTFKCAPPIREADNREQLWEALAEGVIDFVVTDHSPCVPALKQLDRGDFHAAWGGIASLQLGLCTVWTEARRRGLSIAHIARWMSEAPARFIGQRAKGKIASGRDADLIVVDPDAEHVLEAVDLQFRHKISPYLGRPLRGAVKRTLLRGRSIHGPGAETDPLGKPLLARS